MANRQYIGARYVPLFMGVHNPNKSYEALSIVTDANAATSYTSKKTVPVGIALNNSEYWAITGTMSGAILDLQNRVGSVENEIDDINTKLSGKILFVSDSYGTTYGNPAGDNTTIASTIEAITGIDTINLSLSGSGFIRDTGNGTFYAGLVDLVNSGSINPEEYSYLIVAAGRNDWNASESSLDAAVANFYNYAKSIFVNAGMYFGFIANGMNDATHGTKEQQMDCFYAIKKACDKLGVKWLNGVECVMHDYSLMYTDYIHPNVNGKKELGMAIVQCLKGFSYTMSKKFKPITVSAKSGYTVTLNGVLSSEIKENQTIIRPSIFINITLPNPISQSIVQEVIGDITSDAYVKHPNIFVDLPYNLFYTNSDGLPTPLGGRLQITPDGELKLYGIYAPAAIRQLNITNIIAIGNGTTTIPTSDC